MSESTDTPKPLLSRLGEERFTVVIMVSALEATANIDDAEDQAIEAGLDEAETEALLSSAIVEDDDELEQETFGITLALWADDPKHAEQEAHKATRAVLDEQGMEWIAMRTAAVFVGHPVSIPREPPITTLAEDTAPSEAAMDAIFAEPLFPVDLGDS